MKHQDVLPAYPWGRYGVEIELCNLVQPAKGIAELQGAVWLEDHHNGAEARALKLFNHTYLPLFHFFPQRLALCLQDLV